MTIQKVCRPIRRVFVLALRVLAGASVLVTAGWAQPQPPHPRKPPPPHAAPPHAPPPHAAPHWRGDIQRFHEHDWQLWRGGRWQHGLHAGRSGWWWVVGSAWYFYPTPVYPYPNPWEPPPVESVSPPASAPPPPTPYWYYCDSAKGYYPYVPTCPDGWKQVPATPPK